MKSRSWLRTSRRGYTVTEVVTASALTVLVLSSMTAILSMAGTMHQTVSLQTGSDQDAVQAMNRMILEVREAKEVTIPSPSSYRVYFPVIRANGYYDRFVADYNNWLEFYRSDSQGRASTSGAYLWRTTGAGGGRAIAANVTSFRVVQNSTNSIRLTVEVEKRSGDRKGRTQLTERVLYLRNN